MHLQNYMSLIDFLGQVCKFIVNTVNAGAGALAVTVEGPSKVKLECKEVDDGYEFTYTPTAPGDYLITIKYAGTSIVSSPFKAKIEGEYRLFLTICDALVVSFYSDSASRHSEYSDRISYDMSHAMRKSVFGSLRPGQTQSGLLSHRS